MSNSNGRLYWGKSYQRNEKRVYRSKKDTYLKNNIY